MGKIFTPSPYSLSIPLDGSENVKGLRQIEQEQLEEQARAGKQSTTRGIELDSFTNHSTAKGKNLASLNWEYDWYEGPYLNPMAEQNPLTQEAAEHKMKNPESWDSFFWGPPQITGYQAYSIPGRISALAERIEENIVTYMGNYSWIVRHYMVAMILCNIWPLAGFMLCVGLVNLRTAAIENVAKHKHLLLASEQGEDRGEGKVEGMKRKVLHTILVVSRDPAALKNLQLLFFMGLVFILFYFKTIPQVLLGATAGSQFALLHAAFRRSPTEVSIRCISSKKCGLRRLLSKRPSTKHEDMPPEGFEELLMDVIGYMLVFYRRVSHKVKGWLEDLHDHMHDQYGEAVARYLQNINVVIAQGSSQAAQGEQRADGAR